MAGFERPLTYRDDINLVRKYIRGFPVPLAKLKEVIAAACGRIQDDGDNLLAVEMVLRFLDELRPDGPKRWIEPYSSIVREDLLPLLKFANGDRVPQAELEVIIAGECDRLFESDINEVSKRVLRILEGLRPKGPVRKARGR